MLAGSPIVGWRQFSTSFAEKSPKTCQSIRIQLFDAETDRPSARMPVDRARSICEHGDLEGRSAVLPEFAGRFARHVYQIHEGRFTLVFLESWGGRTPDSFPG